MWNGAQQERRFLDENKKQNNIRAHTMRVKKKHNFQNKEKVSKNNKRRVIAIVVECDSFTMDLSIPFSLCLHSVK